MKPCVIDDCLASTTPKTARGLCNKHYKEWRSSRAKPCSFNGCEDPGTNKTLCEAHARQKSSSGELKPKRLPAGTPVDVRFWSYVEKSEGCWEWAGSLDAYGYGRLNIDGIITRAHRIGWTLERGAIPEGMVIDHKCHNPKCVRVSHLRLATVKQNNEYRQGAQANNLATGIRGVHAGRQPGTWYAAIKDNYKQIHLGTFNSVEEADAAVKAARARRFSFPDAA